MNELLNEFWELDRSTFDLIILVFVSVIFIISIVVVSFSKSDNKIMQEQVDDIHKKICEEVDNDIRE